MKNQKRWTEEEDQAVQTLVSDTHCIKWNEIASKVQEMTGGESRSGKQVRERWHNHLDPRLKKSEWTLEEQLTLFSAHLEHGNTWALIGSFLPGRSENSIKNQFYSALRKQFRKWKGTTPTSRSLKKHDSFLTHQLISAIKKKLKFRSNSHTTPEPITDSCDLFLNLST